MLPDAASGQGAGISPEARPESCHAVPRASEVSSGGARRVWRTFCLPIAIGTGTNFIEHYVCRDTSLIGTANLSPITKLGEGTGAAKAVQTITKVVIYHGAVF
ncbi:MAG: hypothetical protein JXA38_03255 [Methanosarcinaceae archaeon]|nr:hypothetical protein [Methanosarcinaceae archaeon]